jgi:hypothetical protein
MNTNEKIFLLITVLVFLAFFLYASNTVASDQEIWVYIIFLPILAFVIYTLYYQIQENALVNAGGNLNVINYYTLDPVFVQIIEDGKFFAWNDYVEPDSITQYEWKGLHEIQVILSDDPNTGNPATTIFFDRTYNVSGNDTILVVLNADGQIFEQFNTN